MSVITRNKLQKELVPGLNALFGLEYKQYPEQYKDIYTIESSDRAFEEEVKLGGFSAAPVKREGEAMMFDTAGEAWTARYQHETIALGFPITEEALEDNLYGALGRRYTKALARSMMHTKNTKGAAVLNNAFNANYTWGDGVTLCNTAHPLMNGGVNSNRPTTGADLAETSLEAAAIAISKWTDERGLLIQAMPKRLVIPTDLQFTATRILKTELRVSTADNDINAMKTNGTIPEGYKVNNFLTDPNAWFIMTDVPDGLKMFQRVAMSTGMDGDFETGNARYKARERYSFGVSDPLGVYGSPGAS